MLWYRSTKQTGLTPDWLDGLRTSGDLSIRHYRRSDGHVVGYCERWRDEPPAEAEWRDIDGTDWQVLVWGVWRPEAILRAQDRLPLVEACDGDGRAWMVPTVLTPYPLDGLAFDVPFGRDWQPDPTPQQSRLIQIGRWSRDAIMRGLEPTESEGRIVLRSTAVTMEQTMAATATADLLSSIYHVTPEVLQASRLIDIKLITETLLAAAGLSPSVLREMQQAAAA